jgi:hypothetical protein
MGPVVRGRELQESMWSATASSSRTAASKSFDVLLLGPHGGDLNGFVILRSDRRQLADVRFSDDFELLVASAAAVGGNQSGRLDDRRGALAASKRPPTSSADNQRRLTAARSTPEGLRSRLDVGGG